MITSSQTPFGVALVLQMLLVGAGQVASAQMVQYTTETTFKIDAFGALGRLIGRRPIVSSNYVTADQMATVTGDNSSIIRLPDRTMISLDHKRKVYTEITFDQMMAAFTNASNAPAQAEPPPEEPAPAEGQNKVTVTDFDVKVEDLGERESILGQQAARKLLTIEVKYTAEATDEEGKTETAEGRFFAVNDAWIAEGIEGQDVIDAFQQGYAQAMQATFQDAGSPLASIGQVMRQDGRIAPAFEKMAEEMEKMEGTALRSTTYMVAVPIDQELDVDALLGRKPAEKKKAGAALGKIARGALKARGIPAGEEVPEAPRQQTLLTMNATYTDMALGPVDASRFQVPAGYTREESPLATPVPGNN
jgi:hypothetical protein